jgi:hypothetical protein
MSDVQDWELWYVTPKVVGSRIIFRADSHDNVVQKARCELFMMDILFDWAWVEYVGYYRPPPRKPYLTNGG